ncbi:hypothetical protein Asp14428_74190 [Actinoplanes sp. NBRC 14428]|nr:hypothetical protein Asp14428_74190 [Actinoplanes sp. NBRC 14428]
MTTAIAVATEAPPARAHRFRLHRAGISNIWQYGEQVFDFEDGRLLLRGKNGAGKSKALEILLPFLLDGDTKRLDATGAGRTTFRWLMSEGATGVNRQGHAWLELRRIDEEGAERFLTLGAVVRWSSSTAEARLAFFLTPSRVGIDVDLVVDHQPVPVDRLRETLGEGAIYATARDYRARVGREVFGITDAGRYRNLVHLLYRLRRPTVGDRIEAGQLTLELSEALPPVDDDVLDNVAHNLDDLESVRADLGRLEATHAALAELMTSYRGYLHGELRRRTRTVDEALAELRRWRRRGGQAEREVDAALEHEGRAQQILDRWSRQERESRAELAALRESAGYRAVQELGQRRVAVEALDAAARAAARAAAADRQTATGAAERLAAESQRLAETTTRLRDGHRQLTALAAEAGLDVGHLAVVPELREGPASAEPALRILLHDLASEEFRRYGERLAAAEAAVRGRRHAVQEVRQLLDQAGAADRAATRAEADRDLLDDQHALALGRLSDVTTGLLENSRAFAHAVREWLASPHLAEAGLAGVRGLLLDEDPLAETVPAEVRAAAEAAAEPLRAAAQGRRDLLLTELSRARSEHDEANAEHRRWSELTDPEPPPTRFRGTARTPRAGTPLYRLVDFAGHLDAGRRAGLEAALEASGLLDALVATDGTVLDPSGGEVLLRPGPAVRGPSLAGVLIPVAGGDGVERLLAGIGLGAGSGAASWIDDAGRWQLDVVRGAWTKPAAEYVGAANREALRRRRLAELERRRTELSAEIDGLETGLAEEDRRRAGLAEVLRQLPDGMDLRAGWSRRQEAETTVNRLGREVAAARRQARELRTTADRRRGEVRAAAEARLLPDDRDELSAVDQRLRQLGADLPRHAGAAGRFAAELDQYASLIARHAEAVGRAAGTADEAEAAAGIHLAEARAYAVLEESLGAEPAAILRREEDAVSRIRAAEAGVPAARRDYEDARDRRVRAENERDHARAELTRQEDLALRAGTDLPRVLTLPGVAEALTLSPAVSVDEITGTPGTGSAGSTSSPGSCGRPWTRRGTTSVRTPCTSDTTTCGTGWRAASTCSGRTATE